MRRRKDELCIFCGNYPCDCGKPKRPQVPKKENKKEPPRVEITDSLVKITDKPIVQQIRSTDELLFEDAIRNLSPLLGSADREKFRLILSSVPSLAERAAIWKARHGKTMG